MLGDDGIRCVVSSSCDDIVSTRRLRLQKYQMPHINTKFLIRVQTCKGHADEHSNPSSSSAPLYGVSHVEEECGSAGYDLQSVHRTRLAISKKRKMRRRTSVANNLKVNEEPRSSLQCRNLQPEVQLNCAAGEVRIS